MDTLDRIEVGASTHGDRRDDVPAEHRFTPCGGGLGTAIGLSSILAARVVYEFVGPIDARPGADVGAASAATIAVVLILVAALLAVPVAMRRTEGGRGTIVRLGAGAAVVVAARVLTHEATIRSALPHGGGGSPIVEVRGRLLESPRPEPVPSGSSGRDHGSSERWRTTIRINAADHPGLLGRDLSVTLPSADARLAAGRVVSMRGRLSVVPAPSNPGESDRRRGSRRGVPARLVVPSFALIEPCDDATAGSAWLLDSIRSGWRDAALVVDAAVTREHPRAEGLVAAVLAGDRSRLSARTRAAAEDAGLAPLLAISGWHVALVAVFAAALVGRHRPLGRLVALVVVTVFALAVVPGPSVRRAATMAIVGSGLLLGGRRPRGLPLVAVAAATVVWLDPAIVGSVGFTLSVLATVGLVIGAGPARRRWFGTADRVGRRRWSILRDPATSVATASIVAWSVSTPLLLATFGRGTSLAVPAMILAAPVFVLLLGTALATTMQVVVFGGAAWPMIRATGAMVDLLVRLADGIAAVSPIVHVVMPTWIELPTLGAAICIAIAFGGESRMVRWSWRMAGMTMFIGAVMVAHATGDRIDRGWMRVDMIAVGDGTAMLIRGSEGAVLVDAGSSSIESVGRRVIVPTLRSLEVGRLDAIVITHANLDHFNAVEDVVRSIPTDRIVIAPPLSAAARRAPESPIGSWLLGMHERRVPLVEVSRGDRLRVADLEVRVLHPREDERCRSANDASIVATIGLASDDEARARLLVCGDIQDEAIARILSREPALAASVMELPHHGSWRPIAVTLLSRVDPVAIVQSTGPERWWMDRWRDACGGRRRGITCRDGIVSLEVDASGVVRWVGRRRSEEPQTRLVPAVVRPAVGTAPDDHDGSVEPRPLGQHRDEDPGHALEQGGARRDPHAGLAEVE